MKNHSTTHKYLISTESLTHKYLIPNSVLNWMWKEKHCFLKSENNRQSWLPVSQRISYRTAVLVWWGPTGCPPSYLRNHFGQVYDLASCWALRSSAWGELLVPQAQSVLKQLQAFSVIGPSTWNRLPVTLHLLPQYNVSSFNKLVKLFIFDCSWIENATEYVFWRGSI